MLQNQIMEAKKEGKCYLQGSEKQITTNLQPNSPNHSSRLKAKQRLYKVTKKE